MGAFLEVFTFECRHQLRSPMFLILAFVFFLMTFLVMASDSVQVGGIGPNLNFNANFAIIFTQYVFSIVGMFAAVAFVAAAITRDRELKTAEILYATGVGERAYLLGRFAGGVLFAGLVGVAAVLGSLVGSLMPWLDPERVGPFTLAPYWYSVWAVVVPNYFIVGAVFFSVAALTRSLLGAYLAALAFIVAYIVISANTDQETIATTALIDPFGSAAFSEITRYWTVFERNHAMPEITGTVLANRAIWLAVALAALAFTAWRYRFAPGGGMERKRRKKADHGRTAPAIARLTANPAFSAVTPLHQLLSQLRMDVRGVLRSVPFYVMLAFGLMNVVGGFYGGISQFFGTQVLPVTGFMIQITAGSYLWIIILVLAWYSGELVHSERQNRVADIVHATPVPSGVLVLSKIGAMWLVVTVLIAVVMLASMLVQAFNGWFDFEVGLYLTGLFYVNGASFYLLAALAVVIQVLAPNKFAGMFAFILVFMGVQVLGAFDFEHNLYTFGVPNAPYSDMNGYGHYLHIVNTYVVYWGLFCVALVVAAHLMFRRGHQQGFAERLAIARERLTLPVAATGVGALAAFVAVGGWIFYNTNVLNEYVTTDTREERQANYEKLYKPLEALPMPQAVAIDMAVDIYPDERRLESRGTAVLVNKEDQPIAEVTMTVAPELTINALDLPEAEQVVADEVLGQYTFRLDPPLAPGERRTLAWDLSWINEGFANDGGTTRVVENGTFVDNTEIVPVPGYAAQRELTDNTTRRKYDLPPARRLPPFGDPAWLDRGQFGVSERASFRAVVSTAPDQIAIAPGYLRREWQEGGRRYFEYVMDDPIWPFVSFVSARYAVARDEWNDVAIEVYHHPAHAWNVENMVRGTKKSLDYFTSNFSPYQYRQFRIMEFPRYATFAQSFPNTIPFSEAIGFVADLRDPEEIDYVFYVTAHELAHQWWGHQVVGAQMQGMTVIVETLAQYSALMVMEQEYGADQMRRFLKYELDNYLSSRGGELIEELPLMKVENQPYIHYRKGSVVLYALQDAIGEDKVNAALRAFIDRFGFRSGSFPTAGDLVAEFRAVAGPEHQDLISDLFERIVLWDLRVAQATVREVDEGFEVTMTVDAHQLEADGAGQESEVPVRATVDVAAFPKAEGDLPDNWLPKPLHLERRTLTSGEQTIRFTLAERPAQVAVDPYVKLIDRNPDDNLKTL